MEFYDRKVGALVRLRWSSPSTPDAVVPQGQLFSTPQPVIVQPDFVVLSEGETLEFSSSGQESMTWTISGGGTLDEDGLYTAPAALTSTGLAEVKATATDGSGRFGTASVLLIPKSLRGQGTGLSATYYNGNFVGPRFRQVDPVVQAMHGSDPVDPLFGTDSHIRWEGQIQALNSDVYTLYAQTAGGVRVWIDGQLLIEDETAWFSLRNASLPMEAGSKHDILIQYDQEGWGLAQLFWSASSMPLTLVPQSQLYPAPLVYGDLDRDGTLEATELYDALRMYLGNVTPSPSDLDAADVRPRVPSTHAVFGDGQIRSNDVNWLLRRYLGLVNEP
jgi:hypothetical protein